MLPAPFALTMAKRIKALEAVRVENARLRAALAYLESRVRDYPVLGVLLKDAHAVPNR